MTIMIIKPLIIDSKLTNGTGITNSSLLVEDYKIHLIMTHVEYTLYHGMPCPKISIGRQGPYLIIIAKMLPQKQIIIIVN